MKLIAKSTVGLILALGVSSTLYAAGSASKADAIDAVKAAESTLNTVMDSACKYTDTVAACMKNKNVAPIIKALAFKGVKVSLFSDVDVIHVVSNDYPSIWGSADKDDGPGAHIFDLKWVNNF